MQLRELHVPHSLLDKLRSQQILAGKCREEGSMRKAFVNGAAGQWHTQAWRGKFPSAHRFLKQTDPQRETVERTVRWSQMVEILADQQGTLEVHIKFKRNCYWTSMNSDLGPSRALLCLHLCCIPSAQTCQAPSALCTFFNIWLNYERVVMLYFKLLRYLTYIACSRKKIAKVRVSFSVKTEHVSNFTPSWTPNKNKVRY